MWRAYFPKAQIIGVDLHDKRRHREKRINTIQADQSDHIALRRLAKTVGEADIIIDDGSHVNADVIATFETFFPLVLSGGFYAIEDVQTSYWPEFGGNPDHHDDPKTTMGYFRKLVDEINRTEFRSKPANRSLAENIMAFHFYHNLILVQKQ
jgi:8-demethyl-8-alpha-L-rhamnosyltetracenomycin-C 2'-O-methyltransferase